MNLEAIFAFALAHLLADKSEKAPSKKTQPSEDGQRLADALRAATKAPDRVDNGGKRIVPLRHKLNGESVAVSGR